MPAEDIFSLFLTFDTANLSEDFYSKISLNSDGAYENYLSIERMRSKILSPPACLAKLVSQYEGDIDHLFDLDIYLEDSEDKTQTQDDVVGHVVFNHPHSSVRSNAGVTLVTNQFHHIHQSVLSAKKLFVSMVLHGEGNPDANKFEILEVEFRFGY